jgi:hypothetical protein
MKRFNKKKSIKKPSVRKKKSIKKPSVRKKKSIKKKVKTGGTLSQLTEVVHGFSKLCCGEYKLVIFDKSDSNQVNALKQLIARNEEYKCYKESETLEQDSYVMCLLHTETNEFASYLSFSEHDIPGDHKFIYIMFMCTEFKHRSRGLSMILLLCLLHYAKVVNAKNIVVQSSDELIGLLMFVYEFISVPDIWSSEYCSLAMKYEKEFNAILPLNLYDNVISKTDQILTKINNKVKSKKVDSCKT